MSTRPAAPFSRRLAALVGPIPREYQVHLEGGEIIPSSIALIAHGVGWVVLPRAPTQAAGLQNCGLGRESRQMPKYSSWNRPSALLASCAPPHCEWALVGSGPEGCGESRTATEAVPPVQGIKWRLGNFWGRWPTLSRSGQGWLRMFKCPLPTFHQVEELQFEVRSTAMRYGYNICPNRRQPLWRCPMEWCLSCKFIAIAMKTVVSNHF